MLWGRTHQRWGHETAAPGRTGQSQGPRSRLCPTSPGPPMRLEGGSRVSGALGAHSAGPPTALPGLGSSLCRLSPQVLGPLHTWKEDELPFNKGFLGGCTARGRQDRGAAGTLSGPHPRPSLLGWLREAGPWSWCRACVAPGGPPLAARRGRVCSPRALATLVPKRLQQCGSSRGFPGADIRPGPGLSCTSQNYPRASCCPASPGPAQCRAGISLWAQPFRAPGWSRVAWAHGVGGMGGGCCAVRAPWGLFGPSAASASPALAGRPLMCPCPLPGLGPLCQAVHPAPPAAAL